MAMKYHNGKYRINGKPVSRKEFFRNCVGITPGLSQLPKRAKWPIKSDAMGVHPDQIPQAIDEARRMGIPTEFSPDGSAILTSAKHRKEFAEAMGFYDRNGGYGDPRRMNRRSLTEGIKAWM